MNNHGNGRRDYENLKIKCNSEKLIKIGAQVGNLEKYVARVEKIMETGAEVVKI